MPAEVNAWLIAKEQAEVLRFLTIVLSSQLVPPRLFRVTLWSAADIINTQIIDNFIKFEWQTSFNYCNISGWIALNCKGIFPKAFISIKVVMEGAAGCGDITLEISGKRAGSKRAVAPAFSGIQAIMERRWRSSNLRISWKRIRRPVIVEEGGAQGKSCDCNIISFIFQLIIRMNLYIL